MYGRTLSDCVVFVVYSGRVVDEDNLEGCKSKFRSTVACLVVLGVIRAARISREPSGNRANNRPLRVASDCAFIARLSFIIRIAFYFRRCFVLSMRFNAIVSVE